MTWSHHSDIDIVDFDTSFPPLPTATAAAAATVAVISATQMRAYNGSLYIHTVAKAVIYKSQDSCIDFVSPYIV